MKFDIIQSDTENPTVFARDDIAEFLYEHLDEYGDEKEDILKSIAYAYGDEAGQNGFILVAYQQDNIVGAVVINDTNMSGYIPEHILVYIAVDGAQRGKGIGKKLMKRIIDETVGDIAL